MAYRAFYREWRPQFFKDIVGQKHVCRTLQNALSSGRVAHAYLFCGPRGTGKTSTAKVLAKALNCLEGPAEEPCNKCANCISITEGVSLDVAEIDAASNRGIEEIRELRERIKYSPTAGNYKIYIIDEVHMLTNEAFNALLKTLEEPPSHVVFVLATTEPRKVPLTILSRCQRFDFRQIGVKDIVNRLEMVTSSAGLNVEKEALLLIGRAAEGSLRDALSILDQCAAFGGSRITVDDIHSILGTVRVNTLESMTVYLACGNTADALALVDELAVRGKDLRLFTRELGAFLRSVLLYKFFYGTASPVASRLDSKDTFHAEAMELVPPGLDNKKMNELSDGFKKEEVLLKIIEIFNQAEQEMKWSDRPRLMLEMSVIKAVHLVKGGWAGVENGAVDALKARVVDLEKELAQLKRILAQGLQNGALFSQETASEEFCLKPRILEESAPEKAGPSAGREPAGEPRAVRKPAREPRVREPVREPSAGREPARVSDSETAGEIIGEAAGRAAGEAAGIERYLTVEQVKSEWNNIIDKVKKLSMPLFMGLREAKLVNIKGTTLTLGFAKDFHKNLVERSNDRGIIEQVVGSVFQQKVRVQCTVLGGGGAENVSGVVSGAGTGNVSGGVSGAGTGGAPGVITGTGNRDVSGTATSSGGDASSGTRAGKTGAAAGAGDKNNTGARSGLGAKVSPKFGQAANQAANGYVSEVIRLFGGKEINDKELKKGALISERENE